MTERDLTALHAARRADAAQKRQRVLTVLHEMVASGSTITFAEVARRANVSTWLVYSGDIKPLIEHERREQATSPATKVDSRNPVSTESLLADVEQLRHENRRLREERDALKARLKRRLADALEGPGASIDGLTFSDLLAANQRLVIERDEAALQAMDAENKVRELEEQLTAARKSLRDMMRQQTLA